MGWEHVLVPRIVRLLDGEEIPYAPNLAWSLHNHGKQVSRNHLAMGISTEALRAWRAGGRWSLQRAALVGYLRDELEDGLWGHEVLCPTPHDAFHLGALMLAREVAVESGNPELLGLTGEACRATGRLCATLADPTGRTYSAGWRVPLAGFLRRQKPPSHSALTAWWRELRGLPQDRVFRPDGAGWLDPMYFGLRALRRLRVAFEDDLGGAAAEEPGRVPLRREVVVHRWEGGHQVEIPRPTPTFDGLTRGSKKPNGVCDWLRVEYGKKPRVTFGMLWEESPPPTPGSAGLALGSRVRGEHDRALADP